MRAILISTCTAVSFAHGSNDGQKGIGIMMAILVVFLPHAFNMNNAPAWVIGSVALVL
ncbi:MAG: inorganic phosphate transporter [bacterium]